MPITDLTKQPIDSSLQDLIKVQQEPLTTQGRGNARLGNVTPEPENRQYQGVVDGQGLGNGMEPLIATDSKSVNLAPFVT